MYATNFFVALGIVPGDGPPDDVAWWQGNGAILLWLVLSALLCLFVAACLASRRHAREMEMNRVELMLAIAKAKFVLAQKEDLESWNRMKQARKDNGRDPRLALAAWYFQRLFLGKDAALEEQLMNDPREGIFISLLLKIATMVVLADLNVSRRDAGGAMLLEGEPGDEEQLPPGPRGTSKGSRPGSKLSDLALTDAAAPAAAPKLGGAGGSGGDEVGVARLKRDMKTHAKMGMGHILAPDLLRHRLKALFRAHNPLVQMLTLSMSAWWVLQLVTLANSILSSLAMSAIFLGTQSVEKESAL